MRLATLLPIGALLSVLLLLVLAWTARGEDEGEGEEGAGPAAGPTRLLLAGDVMLARGIDQIQRHRVDPVLYESYMRSARGYVSLAEEESGAIPRNVEPSYVWGEALVAARDHEPHVRLINLENAATTHDEPWPQKGIHYRMHPENVAVLRAAGIDGAVLANNHAMDWGREGLLETLASLEKAAVAPIGAGRDLEAARRPVRLGPEGGRVLVLAAAHASSGVPAAWAATKERPGVFLLPDLAPSTARALGALMREHRRPGDVVVFSIHWGGNWGYDVPEAQRRFAHTLIEAGGADVVHGHSSHHPKGMEVHRGRLILHGAGDLLNDYEGIGGHETYRPELTLLYLPRLDGEGRLEELVLLPFRIRRFRLERAAGEEVAWLRGRLERESSGLAFTRTEDHLVARPAR